MKYRFIVMILLSTLLFWTGGCSKKEPASTSSPKSNTPSNTSKPASGTASNTPTPTPEEAKRILDLQNAEKYYRAGRQLGIQGQFDAAIEQLELAVGLNPEYYQAWDKLGMLYYNTDRPDEAVEPLIKAVAFNPALTDAQADPDDIAIAAQNCAMLFDIGRRSEAFEYLTALSKLHPNEETLKNVTLFCTLAEKENPSEELQFESIAATDIDACEKNLLLAKGYVFLGNAESATAYYDKVITTCSANTEGLTQAAYYFAMARDPEKAIDICRQGLEVDPTCYPLRYVLTSVYGAMNLFDEAIEVANDGVLAAPNDVRGYYLLANRYMKADRFAAAVGVYNIMLSYVEEDPDYFKSDSASEDNELLDEFNSGDEEIADRFRLEEVHANLALCYNRMNEFEKAVTHAKQAIEANASFAPAYMNLSGAYQGLKQYDKALEAIDKGIELMPTSDLMYLEKAAVYHQLSQPEKAIEPLKTALQQDPGSVMACQALAQTYTLLGRFEQALPYFEKALQNQPDMINVGNVVACYVKLGQKQKALAAYKTYTGRDNASFVAVCVKDGQRALGEKRYDDAAASFETALYANPQSAEAIYGMGCIFVENGKFDSAAQHAAMLEQLDIDLYDELIRRINSGR